MKILVTSLLIMVVLSLTACETIKGLGEDISNAGKAIKKSAGQ